MDNNTSSASSFGVPIRVVRRSTTPWDNDRSTTDTIDDMRALANSGSRSQIVQSVANECLSQWHKERGTRDLIRCAYWWVKGHVTFAEDEDIAIGLLGISPESINTPEGSLDLIISPEVLIQMSNPVGDCDCFSTLLASILIAMGFRVWFVSIKVDQNEPDRWSHVYLMTYLPDEGITLPLDASHGTYPGWEKTNGVFERKEWYIN